MTNVAAHIMAAGSDGLSIYIPQKKKKIYIYIYIWWLWIKCVLKESTHIYKSTNYQIEFGRVMKNLGREEWTYIQERGLSNIQDWTPITH